jgi:hypothetical protein
MEDTPAKGRHDTNYGRKAFACHGVSLLLQAGMEGREERTEFFH